MVNKPDFIELFLESLKLDYKTGGLKRLIPYVFTGCIAIGVIISHIIPIKNNYLSNLFPLIAALITAQGIILAISMQTSSIILQNIAEGDFSLYLKRIGLLNYYMLLVQFIQIVHLLSLCTLLLSGIVVLLNFSHKSYITLSMGVGLGMFLYALRWTWGASVIVRDLIYYRSEYNAIKQGLNEHFSPHNVI